MNQYLLQLEIEFYDVYLRSVRVESCMYYMDLLDIVGSVPEVYMYRRNMRRNMRRRANISHDSRSKV